MIMIFAMVSLLEKLCGCASTTFPGILYSDTFKSCWAEVESTATIRITEQLSSQGWLNLMKVLNAADVSGVKGLILPMSYTPINFSFAFMHRSDHDLKELARLLKSGRFLALETLHVETKTFEVSGNSMTYMSRDASIMALGEALKTSDKLCNLRSLRVPNCDSINIMKAVAEGNLFQLRLFSVHDRMKNIHFFDLSKQVEIAGALQTIYHSYRFLHLEHLELVNGALGGEAGFQALVLAVKSRLLPDLRVLQIKGNQFSAWPRMDLGSLVDGNEDWFNSLTVLGVNDCNISSKHMTSMLEKIAPRGNALALQRLEARDNPLDSASIVPLIRLAKAFSLRELEHLDLSCSTTENFTATGWDTIIELVNAIKADHLPSLQILDFRENPIGDDVGRAIVCAYEKNATLTTEILISWRLVRDSSLQGKASKWRQKNLRDSKSTVDVVAKKLFYHFKKPKGKQKPEVTDVGKVHFISPGHMHNNHHLAMMAGNGTTLASQVQNSSVPNLSPDNITIQNSFVPNLSPDNSTIPDLDNWMAPTTWVENSPTPLSRLGDSTTLNTSTWNLVGGNGTSGDSMIGFESTTDGMITGYNGTAKTLVNHNGTAKTLVNHNITAGRVTDRSTRAWKYIDPDHNATTRNVSLSNISASGWERSNARTQPWVTENFPIRDLAARNVATRNTERNIVTTRNLARDNVVTLNLPLDDATTSEPVLGNDPSTTQLSLLQTIDEENPITTTISHILPDIDSEGGFGVGDNVNKFLSDEQNDDSSKESSTSIVELKSLMEKLGLGEYTSWKVSGEAVKFEVLISLAKLDEVRTTAQQDYDAVKEEVTSLGLLSDHRLREIDEVASTSHVPSVSSESKDVITREILREEIQKLVDTVERDGQLTRQRFDTVPLDGQLTRHVLESMKKEWNDAFADTQQKQNLLVKHVQALQSFSVEERARSVPRFLYLSKRGKAGIWISLKEAFRTPFEMHLLCEARFEDGLLHEVKDQQGFTIKKFKPWLVKIAPWLRWSLHIAVIVGKITSGFLLPGLGILFPDFQSQNISAVLKSVYSAAALTEAQLAENPDPCSDGEVGSVDAPINLKERLIAEAVVGDLIREKGRLEFAKNIGLRKVFIDKIDQPSTSHARTCVAWVCDICYVKYGSKVIDITPSG